MLVSFPLLYQNTLDKHLYKEERLIVAHGFSSWLIGSTDFVPVVRQNIMLEAYGSRNYSSHGRRGTKSETGRI